MLPRVWVGALALLLWGAGRVIMGVKLHELTTAEDFRYRLPRVRVTIWRLKLLVPDDVVLVTANVGVRRNSYWPMPC